MQTRILAALLCGCAAAGGALAETLVVNDQVQVRESQLDRPKRGSTMSEVEKHFGAPVARHPTVGGAPKCFSTSLTTGSLTRWSPAVEASSESRMQRRAAAAARPTCSPPTPSLANALKTPSLANALKLCM